MTVEVKGRRAPLVVWAGGEFTIGRPGERRPDVDAPGILAPLMRADALTGRIVGVSVEGAVRVAAALAAAAGPHAGAPGDASRSLPRGCRPSAEPLPSVAPETVDLRAVRRGTTSRPECHIRRCPRRAELGGACERCTRWFVAGGTVPIVPADGVNPNQSRIFKAAIAAICYAWYPRVALHLFTNVAPDTLRRWVASTHLCAMAMAGFHLARVCDARPHRSSAEPKRGGAVRIGDLAAIVATLPDSAARWPLAVVAEDWIARQDPRRLAELALYGLTSVGGEGDDGLPFTGDPAGVAASPLRAAGLLTTGDGESDDASLVVLDAALLHALVLATQCCDAVVSYRAPPDDETSVVVAAEPPIDLAGVVDSATVLHVAASNFLTPPVLADLARAPCRQIVFHGAPPGAVPPGLSHLPTGLPLSTVLWETLCGMAASRDFPAWSHDDGGAPAPTVAGLAKMVCGARAIGRCPLGDGDLCCAACAEQSVNYIDAFTAASAAGRELPECATAGWSDSTAVVSRAVRTRARDTWLSLVSASSP